MRSLALAARVHHSSRRQHGDLAVWGTRTTIVLAPQTQSALAGSSGRVGGLQERAEENFL